MRELTDIDFKRMCSHHKEIQANRSRLIELAGQNKDKDLALAVMLMIGADKDRIRLLKRVGGTA